MLAVDDSYLNEYREKSLTETIRCLSAKSLLKSHFVTEYLGFRNKSDLDVPFRNRDSVEITFSGIKRKNRSVTSEETKKFKSDTSSFFSSPLTSLRGRFKSDAVAVPLCCGATDIAGLICILMDQAHTVENRLDDKKSWCSLM